MEARSNKRNAEPVEEERKKITKKEMTKSLKELKDLPIEVLVKILNFLSNHDIRCGISLACKEFYKICQDQSLVPVKDLCIYGHPVDGTSEKEGKQCYILRSIRAVSDIIFQSKNLTSLKIKALSPDPVNELVSMALQSCPKLTELEIVETPKQIGEYFESKLIFLALGNIFLIFIFQMSSISC